MARPKRLAAAPVSGSAQELLEQMREYIASAGYRDDNGILIDGASYSPLLVLCRMSIDYRLKPSERLQAAREVASYLYPKMSSLQIAGDSAKPILIHHGLQVIDGRTMKPVDPEQVEQLKGAGVETINVRVKSFSNG